MNFFQTRPWLTPSGGEAKRRFIITKCLFRALAQASSNSSSSSNTRVSFFQESFDESNQIGKLLHLPDSGQFADDEDEFDYESEDDEIVAGPMSNLLLKDLSIQEHPDEESDAEELVENNNNQPMEDEKEEQLEIGPPTGGTSFFFAKEDRYAEC